MKNNMRTPKEKEQIVKELLSCKTGWNELCRKYNISQSVLYRWKYSYLKAGIEGLKSRTGTSKGGNKGIGVRKPKSREEELELKIMRLEIENARLKKGYLVKGVGAEKEYVTTLEKNMK